MVLLSVPDYNHGQGLEIHIRTKVVRFFSYVERIALKIGDDVLEVSGGMRNRKFWHNGKEGSIQKKKQEDGVLLPIQVGGNSVSFESQSSGISWQYTIDLPEGQKVVLKTVKEYMRVDVQEPKQGYFGTAKGLMGTFQDDRMLSRDGSIYFADPNQYGEEWQVRDTDRTLFGKPDGPQYPEQCEMPSNWWERSITRRLAEGSISLNDAEKACAHVRKVERNDCVNDVVGTGDLEMALGY